MIVTVCWVMACRAVLFELVISRPNSRDSLATLLGIEVARVDFAAWSVFDFETNGFSESLTRVLEDALVLVMKFAEPWESCLLKR